MKTLRAILGIVTLLSMILLGKPLAPIRVALACELTSGFSALREMIALAEEVDIVGECLDDARYDAEGNAAQLTSNGMMGWNRATNWTGFTDGTTTWVNGPDALEKRPNGERLAWEDNARRPEGPAFDMFRPATSGSFVAVQDQGYLGFRYLVNGTPEVFIGMGYNPIYRQLPNTQRAANYDRDFKILCEAGVNHITGWDADKGFEQDKFDEVTLDHAHKYSLGVIMPFYLPASGNYMDQVFTTGLMGEASVKIERFKSHPALRMWGVGNEVLVVMKDASQRAAFTQFYVDLIDLFHSLDPDHPVIYREAEDLFVPFIRGALDSSPKPRPWFIYGMNVYTTRLDRILDNWPAFGIDSPILVSEFGAGPEWPGGRSIGYVSMWKTIRAYPSYVLGGAPYVWTTQGPEPTDLKWGLMDEQSNPVDGTFNFLRAAWLIEGRRSCPP